MVITSSNFFKDLPFTHVPTCADLFGTLKMNSYVIYGPVMYCDQERVHEEDRIPHLIMK